MYHWLFGNRFSHSFKFNSVSTLLTSAVIKNWMSCIQRLVNISSTEKPISRHVTNYTCTAVENYVILNNVLQQTFTILRLLFPALQRSAILNWLRMNSNLTVEATRGKITELVLFANTATAMMKVEGTHWPWENEKEFLPSPSPSLLQNGVQSDFFCRRLPSYYQDNKRRLLSQKCVQCGLVLLC